MLVIITNQSGHNLISHSTTSSLRITETTGQKRHLAKLSRFARLALPFKLNGTCRHVSTFEQSGLRRIPGCIVHAVANRRAEAGRVCPCFVNTVGHARKEPLDFVAVVAAERRMQKLQSHDLDQKRRLDRFAVKGIPFLCHPNDALPFAVILILCLHRKVVMYFGIRLRPARGRGSVRDFVMLVFGEGRHHVATHDLAGRYLRRHPA